MAKNEEGPLVNLKIFPVDVLEMFVQAGGDGMTAPDASLRMIEHPKYKKKFHADDVRDYTMAALDKLVMERKIIFEGGKYRLATPVES